MAKRTGKQPGGTGQPGKLSDYRGKRDLAASGEPGGGRRFVVQEHRRQRDITGTFPDQVGRGEGGELCAPFRGQGSRGTPTRDRAIPVATDSLKSGRSLRHAVPPWIYSHARPNC